MVEAVAGLPPSPGQQLESQQLAVDEVLEALVSAVVRDAKRPRVRADVGETAQPPMPNNSTYLNGRTLERRSGGAVPIDVDQSTQNGRQERATSVPETRLESSDDLIAMSVERHRRSESDLKLLAGNAKGDYWHIEDGFDLNVSPAHKRRRTTVRRPQTSKAPEEFVANLIANGHCWEEDTRTLEQLIEAIKERLIVADDGQRERILLGQILRTGILAGQPVTVTPNEDEGIQVAGHLMRSGKVSCSCADCEGDAVTVAAFEEHSGTSERRISAGIDLTSHSISLQELCKRVNVACGCIVSGNGTLQKPVQKLRPCSVCKQTSRDLLRCGGGCKTRSHASCVGLEPSYRGPWSCQKCKDERVQLELERLEEARSRTARRVQKMHDRAESRRASGRPQDTPKSSQSKKGHFSKSTPAARSSSKPQRVHMAAPTAKVGLSQGRLVRNSHKNKRLFDPEEPNGLKDGEKVYYKPPQGQRLLEGAIRVTRHGPCGILCSCCGRVVSCSQFEAHAGRGSRRHDLFACINFNPAPYDNIVNTAGVTLRRLACALPSEASISPAEVEDEPDAVQEDMLGGCVLCDEKNFQREGFSDLTVILCDQCEREFHVGCLRQHKNIDLQGLPEGDWFCSDRCGRIHRELREHVRAGPVEISAEYQWQLLHGKDGSHSTTWALKACHEILQESFDPIIDQVSGQDLVKGMVHSAQQGDWDHSGMFAAVLRFKKHPVCALVMRAFGDMLAEVPLIATRMEARRKGHARYLMNALADLLAEIGVRTLSLPAAHATVETWTKGFGFQPMAADQLLETRESLRLLVFPGTEVLYRVLLPDADPYPAATVKKKPELPSKEGPAGAKEDAKEGADPEKEGLPCNLLTGEFAAAGPTETEGQRKDEAPELLQKPTETAAPDSKAVLPSTEGPQEALERQTEPQEDMPTDEKPPEDKAAAAASHSLPTEGAGGEALDLAERNDSVARDDAPKSTEQELQQASANLPLAA